MVSSERQQIAYFTNSYRPMINGVVRSITSFRKALTEQGHNVFIFAPSQPGYEDRERFVFRYPALDLGLPEDFPAPIPISNFVDRLLPSLKLDVIHSHYPFILGQSAAGKAEELGLPLVFTFHTRYRQYTHYVPILGEEVAKDLFRDIIKIWILNYMRRCQHIIAPSQSMQEILKNDYGVRGPISTLPTGVEPENFEAADGQAIRQAQGWQNQIILISIGRLAFEKNWTILIDAVQRVFMENTNARWIILGDGKDRESMAAYVSERSMTDRVEFFGKLPFERVPAYLKAADLFCFASLTETQGLVTLEAMAAGLPVVAVDASGTRDVLENGKQGFLVQNDQQALAQAILQIIRNPDLAGRFKDEGLEKARELSITNQANKLLNIYAEAKEAQQAGKYVEIDEQTVGG